LIHFDDVFITEYIDNNYKLKIKKNDPNNKSNPSNGFLFGYVEDLKQDCFISEYSISQTSLEQIFNKFASEVGEEVLQSNNRKEMKITQELLNSVVIV
jgi:hypothetical protein